MWKTRSQTFYNPNPCFPIFNFNIWNCIAIYAAANCVSLQSRTSFRGEPARKIPRLVHWGRSPILSNLVLFKAVWTANMSIMSRRESINVHSICPDNQIIFMCHPSTHVCPSPHLSGSLWRKLLWGKFQATENFRVLGKPCLITKKSTSRVKKKIIEAGVWNNPSLCNDRNSIWESLWIDLRN